MFAWFRWDNLSTKIIVWSFVPTAIILLAVALVTLNAYQEVTKEFALERDRELTRLAANQFIFDAEPTLDQLMDLTLKSNIYNAEPSNQQGALIRSREDLAPFTGGVVILNAQGMVSATLPFRPELFGQDWSNRSYFQPLSEGKERFSFTDITHDGISGEEVVGIAASIMASQSQFIVGAQNLFNGVVVGLFDLHMGFPNVFTESLEKLKVGESGLMYLVDGGGRVIYHSDPSQVGRDFSAHAVVAEVLQDNVGAVRTLNVFGQDIVAGYAPVQFTPWGLITEESWATLTADSQYHAMLLFLLLVLGVVVPTFVVLVGIKRIMRPIEALITAAGQVARGQFGKKISVNSQDEIGKLAEQFNLMSTKLQESYANLEQRVADRTLELTTLYDVASVANESLDLGLTLDRTFHQVLKALGAEIGSIQLLDDKGALHIAIQQGIPNEVVEAIEQMPIGSGLGYWIIEHDEPLVVQDVSQSDNVTEITRAMAPHAYVGVPVRAKKKILGVLSVARTGQSQFSPDDVALLGSIADQVGVAIENARLYEQAEHAAVMEERGRLARDLHDSVTQSLYSVTLFAEAARRLTDEGNMDSIKQYLEELGENAQQALKELRLLVYELRPSTLEHEGLVGALQHRLSTVEERAGVKTQLLVDGAADLSDSVEEAFYRIAQEALNNSLKHAAASEVRVQLRSITDQIAFSVSDNGTGFDPAQIEDGGIGMMSMRERMEKLGGSLEVISSPGGGTTVQCELVLK